MNKLKRIFTCAVSVVLAAAVALPAVACKNVEYPDFINSIAPHPEKPNPGDEFNGDYTISVKSEGGLSISGVKVSAVLNGKTVAEGISIDGKIEFSLDPAEYTLVVDESTLPAGYFVEDGLTFKTKADDGKASVVATSAIIPTPSTGGVYSLGDVMHDFMFTDAATGEHKTLSEVFETKKAVVLNFFYTTCNPCRTEFPAMQTVYERYSDDLEIIALTNHGESQEDIREFKRDLNLSFIMAQDQAGIHNLFNVTSWPQTVIIDRYGTIAHIDKGGAITEASSWSALVSKFLSENYSQIPPEDQPSTDEYVKPGDDIVMPPSADIEAAINGEGTAGKVSNYRLGESEDAQKESWPWLIGEDGDGKYLYSPNAGVNYSYSTLYVDLSLQSGDIVSFDYKLNSEVDCDQLIVLLVDLEDVSNNDPLARYSGDTNGWTSVYAIYTANRPINITLGFTYYKDQLQGPASGEEIAAIKNLRILEASDIPVPTDAETPAVSGDIVDGKYESYENVRLNPADGYYHLYDEESGTYGALLLADILDPTMWSTNVVGKSTFINSESKTTDASLYLISYWTMSNHGDDARKNGLKFTFDRTPDRSISENLISYYYLQSFSDNGYVPVTEALKEVMTEFTKEYCRVNGKQYYDEQWLELCYYFVHYGDPHGEGEVCDVYTDPTAGMTRHNAFTAVESTDGLAANHVKVTKINMEDGGGGQYYRFVPSHSGIYHITTTKKSTSVDPLIMVRTARGSIDVSVVAELDDDMSPAKFTKPGYNNVDGYVYLEADEVYFLQCRFHQMQSTGEYDFFIKYTGQQEYEYLRFATTGEGMWTYEILGEDEDGNIQMGDMYYLAINAALGPDNKYHAVNRDGSFGSLIYIDFIHPQYYDTNDHTLLDLIANGYFDFTATGGGDYTGAMIQLYENSLVGKSEDDETYGLVEATRALVTIISNYLEMRHGEPLETGYWLSFACYYQHIGRRANPRTV